MDGQNIAELEVENHIDCKQNECSVECFAEGDFFYGNICIFYLLSFMLFCTMLTKCPK